MGMYNILYRLERIFMYSREEEISSILASSSCFNNHLPGEV